MKKLLVVIDMVNGFVNFGNLADKNINRIVPNIIKLIKIAKENNLKIIAFKDSHAPDDEEFKMFPVHCVKGTDECNLVPELLPFEKYMTSIEKPTTNGFVTPEFLNIIGNQNFDEISVCGCCTDICVFNFLESLNAYLLSGNKKTKVVVFEDAIDTFNAQNHNADEINKNYINIFKEKFNLAIEKVNKQNQFGN